MTVRSSVAGFAGVFLFALASAPAPAAAQCSAGCDGPTNWSGFWLGAGIGGEADIINHDYIDQRNVTGGNPSYGTDEGRGAHGFIGTIGVGYDWQIRDRWLLGAYADFDFGGLQHEEKDWGDNWKSGWDIEHNTTWSLGGRVGLATSNTALIYGLVGYSQANVEAKVYASDNTGSVESSHDLTYHGWHVGVGMEQDLGHGFSLKGEYRYTDYGSESFDAIELDGDTEHDKFDLDSHAFKLSLIYKFGRREEVSYKDVPPAESYK